MLPDHSDRQKNMYDTLCSECPQGIPMSDGSHPITIRNYSEKDYHMVSNWWELSGEMGPQPSSMPLDSSFIAEISGIPVACVSVYLTNCKDVCWIENLIGASYVKKSYKKEATTKLIDFVYSFAKELGYKQAICFSMHEGLSKRYEDLGMTRVVTNLTSFSKVL